MIVDSDPLQRLALCAIIARIDGFTVVGSTGDFRAALDLCRRDQPDLAIIDLAVPWLTGLDLSKAMLNACDGLCVYVMSAHGRNDMASLGINVSGFITKPTSPDELSALLDRHRLNHAPRPSPLLEKILDLVRAREFGTFHRELPRISVSLQTETNRNPYLLNERLADLRQALSGQPAHEPDPLNQLFPLEDVALLTVVTVVGLCVFVLVDRAFKLSCLKLTPRLQKVFAHIDSNLSEPFGLKDLVQRCHISQGHLSRTFKKGFNVSVMEYIHMKKLALAKALFLFSEKSVTEVAIMTGYNERGYFGKVFKKYENSTIQQFRQLTVRADTQAALVMSHSHWKLLEALGGQNLRDFGI
jgi:two-component system response regulator YesN